MGLMTSDLIGNSYWGDNESRSDLFMSNVNIDRVEPSSALVLRANLDRQATKATVVAGVVIGIVLTLALFGLVMSRSLDHDEHLFVSAGVLAQHVTLYRDFIYGHLPNLPLLLGAIYKLSGTAHYLLTARLLIFACWLVTMACTFLIARDWTGSAVVGYLAAILFVSNQLFLSGPGILATNSLVPVPLSLVGIYLLFRALEPGKFRAAMFFASGAFISIAIGMKANYVFLAPVTTLALVLIERGMALPQRLLRRLLPFAAGAVLAGMPTLWFAALYPESFFYSVYESTATTHVQYWAAHDPDNPTLRFAGKLRYAYGLWGTGTSLLIFFCIFATAAGIAVHEGIESLRAVCRNSTVSTLGILCALAAAMSFVPTPSWDQYFTPVIPFAILLLLSLIRESGAVARQSAMAMLVCAATIGTAISSSSYSAGLRAALSPGEWTGLQTFAAGRLIRSQVCGPVEGDRVCAGRVATLSPIFVMEAGLFVYPELASGPFVYRQADYIPEDRRTRLVVTSAKSVHKLLEGTRPNAIFTGFEGALDEALESFAQAHDARKVPVPYNGKVGELYLLPQQAESGQQ